MKSNAYTFTSVLPSSVEVKTREGRIWVGKWEGVMKVVTTSWREVRGKTERRSRVFVA